MTSSSHVAAWVTAVHLHHSTSTIQTTDSWVHGRLKLHNERRNKAWLITQNSIVLEHTSLPCWCTSVSMDWRWPTWLTLYSLSLDFLVDNACVHHRPRTRCTYDTRGQYLALSKAWRSCYYCVCGTGCTTDTAFHDRRPSVPRRCGKNLEQSAIRSDAIKVSQIIQDYKLKTRLFSASFPQLTVKWLKCNAFATRVDWAWLVDWYSTTATDSNIFSTTHKDMRWVVNALKCNTQWLK